jgi:hypothetical protein
MNLFLSKLVTHLKVDAEVSTLVIYSLLLQTPTATML